jgi:hypothetical protein
MRMQMSTRALFSVLVLAALAAALASAAPATSPKPTRVSANVDYVQLNPCFVVPPTYGHLEVVAYDDDPAIAPGLFDRQIDRVSITVTRADGTVWEQDPLGVRVGEDGHSIFVATTSWATGFWLYDGGSPGSGSTGAFDQGVAVTNDWMRYLSFSGCLSARFYLTGGNIKVTTGS